MPLEGLLEASRGPLGGLLGAYWGLLGGLLSGKRKTRVRRTSGLPTLFDEAVLDFDGPVFVGCLQRELSSNSRLALVIFLTAPSGQPESPEPESYVSPILVGRCSFMPTSFASWVRYSGHSL